MRSNKQVSRQIAVAMIFIASLSACVKQRPDFVNKGENLEQLYPMGDSSTWKMNADSGYIIKSTKYTIHTSDMMKKSENTAAEKSRIEPGTTFIKHLDIMNYESNDPLLTGTAQIAEMFGEPQKFYPVQHEITPDFLILNKVVTEKEVSTFEKTYSRRQGTNWIVPVGGYPIIGFYTVEKAVNEDNRSTNVVTKYPVPSQNFKKATHYDIDESSFKKFGRIQKTDVLPKSFFTDGEWYFSETVVKVRYDRQADVGELGSADSDLNPASRIKFEVKDNSLIGLNTNVDEDFKNDENNENYNTVVKLPVVLSDYKRDKTGDGILSEVEDTEKKTQERSFIKLDFSNVETPESAANGGSSEDNVLDRILNKVNQYKTLLDVTFADNFMSFSIHDARSGQIKRFAMKKIIIKAGEQGTLKPRRWFKEDNMLFGVFPTQKAKKMDFKVHQLEDLEKLLIMARHNPDKDIVYHFSDQTPKDDWYRNMGREAVNIWQQGFKKAGLKNTVRLDESFDVALGDIRYNVMNIVKNGIGGNLGYGPSLTDSETGEMVSSSMNLGMEPILARHYDAVRSYLARTSGNVYNLQIVNKETTLPLVFQLASAINTNQAQLRADGTWTLNDFSGLDETGAKLDPSKFSEDEKSLLSLYGISSDASVRDIVVIMRDQQNVLSQFGFNSRFASFRSYGDDGSISSTSFIDNFISKECPSVVKLAERMKKSIVLTNEELPIIEPCVSMLAQSEGLWAAIHEMGHNFSLAHNFKGSADSKNYPEVGSYTHKYLNFPQSLMKLKTSSAMDYLTTEGRQLMPGNYDIAALRWIYRGEVADVNGNFVKIDLTKPISATLPESQRKKYFFCSDSNKNNYTDPLCDVFDQGLSSKDIVKFEIDDTYKELSGIYRYHTTGSSLGPCVRNGQIVGSRLDCYLQSKIVKLKQQYDTWRNFLKNETGLNRKYLQNMSIEEYQAVINKIPDQKAVKEYLEVRNMIARFLLNIAFMNNKYCVVTQGSDTLEKYVELERIRKELIGLGDTSKVNTCTSPAVTAHLAKKSMVVKREIGHFLESGTYSLDPNTNQRIDFSGTRGLRLSAFGGLVARVSPSLVNLKDGYAPNLIDEPDIRMMITNILLDRVANGVRVDALKTQDIYQEKSDLFTIDDLKKWQSGTALKNFDSEKDVVKGMVAAFIQNLAIPGDGQATNQRLKPFFVSTIQNPELVKGQYTNLYNFGNGYLWVRSNEGFAGKVMQRTAQLDQQKQMAQIDPKKIKPLKNTVLLELGSFLPKDGAPVTVADLLKIQAGVQQIMSKKDKVKDADFIAAISLMLETELTVLDQVDQSVQSKFQVDLATLQQVANDASGDPQQKEQATQILAQVTATPIADLYKQIDAKLLPPTLANLSTRFDGIIATLTPTFDDYVRNSEEYDAQNKLLLDILLMSSNMF